MTTFSELGLAEPILKALSEANHVTPTPIQAEAIPQVLAGRDLVGIAQTGTGKTAAFALPILNHLVTHRRRPERRTARALVLSPTRELSGQILDSFRLYGKHVRPSTALAIGGVPLGRQARALMNGVDVLVATPGRLVDLMENDAVRLNEVEVFVLDEADQMLDMGFIHAIRAIVAKLPSVRRNLFFSATMPKEIEKLAAQLLTDPVRVAVTPVAKTADKIDQRVILTDRNGKPGLLAEVLSDEAVDRALVFSRTKHGADRVVKGLAAAGIDAEAIHGNKSQPQRERALAAFREGKVRVLVATDIAARGIDVPGVSHVVNYDLPNVPESYVHRIGRTARAGREGIAISFCDGEERAFLRDIERLIKISIPSTDRRGESRGERRPPRADGESREGAPREAREGGRHERPRHEGARREDGRHGGGRFGGEGRGERPAGDRPRQDRPHSDRPYGDRPRSDRPFGERVPGERPHGEERRDGERHHRSGPPRGPRPAGEAGEGRAEHRGPRSGPRPEHRSGEVRGEHRGHDGRHEGRAGEHRGNDHRGGERSQERGGEMGGLRFMQPGRADARKAPRREGFRGNRRPAN